MINQKIKYNGKIRVWAAVPTHMHSPQVNRNCVNEMLVSMFSKKEYSRNRLTTNG